MHQGHYLPLVAASLTVLLLGCWNPPALQETKHGRPQGYPSYLWLALLSLLVGLLTCFALKPQGLYLGNGRLGGRSSL